MHTRQDKIIVHLLKYAHLHVDHARILLEQETEDGLVYYVIDNNCKPEDTVFLDNGVFFAGMLKRAAEDISFEITGDMNAMIDAWKKKHAASSFNPFTNNCADVAIWFLQKFTQVGKLGVTEGPVTLDSAIGFIPLPSFMQFCSLPGRLTKSVASELAEKCDEKKTDQSVIPLLRKYIIKRKNKGFTLFGASMQAELNAARKTIYYLQKLAVEFEPDEIRALREKKSELIACFDKVEKSLLKKLHAKLDEDLWNDTQRNLEMMKYS